MVFSNGRTIVSGVVLSRPPSSGQCRASSSANRMSSRSSPIELRALSTVAMVLGTCIKARTAAHKRIQGVIALHTCDPAFSKGQDLTPTRNLLRIEESWDLQGGSQYGNNDP